MHSYQLQPKRSGRTWWATVGVTLLVLLVPVALWWPAPAPERGTSEVVLGTDDWEVPVTVDGAPLECEENPLATSGVGWYCGNTVIETITERATDDPDHALRRLTSGLTMAPVNERNDILREGDTRMLIDGAFYTVGMSLQGSGEFADRQMFVTVTGAANEVAAVADAIWRAFTGKELPAAVLDTIAAMGARPVLPESLFPELPLSPEVSV